MRLRLLRAKSSSTELGANATDRRDRLLAFADCDNEYGLEIGPLDKALVLRKPGRKIFYCDYANRDELRRKSESDPNVNIDLIPEIDFITTRITADTFGEMRFDYIVASHVIEHVPDLIGWLTNLLSSLRPGGRIILAIPDKRYTFDYTRPLTTTGELIEAYLEQRSRPTISQVYDGFSQAVHLDSKQIWNTSKPPKKLTHQYSKWFSLRLAREAFKGSYHDCHCWVFTHDSFMLLVRELGALGILNVRIISHTEPVYGSNEFHVVLGFETRPDPAVTYEGKIIYQEPAGRGKEDGWYIVKDGLRHWITDAKWLDRNGYLKAPLIEISSDDFYAIEEGTPITDLLQKI